jgi:hypothetical protein
VREEVVTPPALFKLKIEGELSDFVNCCLLTLYVFIIALKVRFAVIPKLGDAGEAFAHRPCSSLSTTDNFSVPGCQWRRLALDM